jgi:hypothetical protein
MSEYDPTRSENRQVLSAVVGTLNSTLLGPVPPQMTLEILSETFVNPGTTVPQVGYLLQSGTIQGYSALGTATGGTIVEPFSVLPGSMYTIGSGQGIVAVVGPGCNLYGLAMGGGSGSAVVKLVYRYGPGRGV